MQISTAIAMHIGHIKPLITHDTLRLRRQVLERFADHIGTKTAIKAVRQPDVQDWVNGLQVAAATVHLRYGIIRGFFHDAIRHHWIKADPTLDVSLPRRPRKQPRAFTREELLALGQVLPDARARLIVALSINEGLRRLEICRLEMDDLDLSGKVIRVVTAKSQNEDYIPLTDDTHDRYLLAHLAERGRGAGPLIRSYTSPFGALRPGYLGAMVSGWCADAGIKSAPHDGKSLHAGRHTCASTLLDHDAPPEVIQRALRHASLSSTWTYLRNRKTVEDLRPWMGHTVGG